MQKTIKCPKCGIDNLNWRSKCEKCGEKLHPEDSIHSEPLLSAWSIIAIIIAVIFVILAITCFAAIN